MVAFISMHSRMLEQKFILLLLNMSTAAIYRGYLKCGSKLQLSNARIPTPVQTMNHGNLWFYKSAMRGLKQRDKPSYIQMAMDNWKQARMSRVVPLGRIAQMAEQSCLQWYLNPCNISRVYAFAAKLKRVIAISILR